MQMETAKKEKGCLEEREKPEVSQTVSMEAEGLRQELHTKFIGKELFWREQVDSTMNWAKQEVGRCCGKELDGAVFLAEEQTAGKGRLGRVWKSIPGQNVYMTLLLMQPEISPVHASSLTLLMGLSAAQAAAEITGLPAGIKWPNDVVMSGRKICGILTEMQLKGQETGCITIGVGVNVNQREFPKELQDKAVSLCLEKGEPVSRVSVAARILENFEKYYEVFLKTQDLSAVRQEYEGLLLNKDQQVRILEKEGERIGVARGITEQGELLVEEEDGRIRKVSSGEVSVRGLYSYV